MGPEAAGRSLYARSPPAAPLTPTDSAQPTRAWQAGEPRQPSLSARGCSFSRRRSARRRSRSRSRRRARSTMPDAQLSRGPKVARPRCTLRAAAIIWLRRCGWTAWPTAAPSANPATAHPRVPPAGYRGEVGRESMRHDSRRGTRPDPAQIRNLARLAAIFHACCSIDLPCCGPLPPVDVLSRSLGRIALSLSRPLPASYFIASIPHPQPSDFRFAPHYSSLVACATPVLHITPRRRAHPGPLRFIRLVTRVAIRPSQRAPAPTKLSLDLANPSC